MNKRVTLCALVLAFALGAVATVFAGGLSDAKKEFKNAVSIGDFAAAGQSFMTAAEDDTRQAAEWINKNRARRGKYELYSGAKQALVEMKSDGAIEGMCKRAKGKSFEEKMLLAEVFRSMGDPKTADALVNMVLDKKPEVVREAAISLSERGIREGVDNLITAFASFVKIRGRTFEEIRKALVSIVGSGADLMTEADWRNYWEIKKNEKEGEEESAPGAGEKVVKGDSPRTFSDNPKFFGEEVASKRILFILDGSGSMRMSASNPQEQQQYPQNALLPDARITLVKNELLKCVKELKKTARFDLIIFNDNVQFWSEKLIPAKEAAKGNATKFVTEWKAGGFTFADVAIEKAFTSKSYKDVDTIFFLSDGAPYHGETASESSGQLMAKILSFCRDKNMIRKVKIFTFGFVRPGSQGRDATTDFMKKLAKENGGKFKVLP